MANQIFKHHPFIPVCFVRQLKLVLLSSVVPAVQCFTKGMRDAFVLQYKLSSSGIVTSIPTLECLSFPCEYKRFPSHISYACCLYKSIYDLRHTMISIMYQTSKSEGVRFILKSASLQFPVESWFYITTFCRK